MFGGLYIQCERGSWSHGKGSWQDRINGGRVGGDVKNTGSLRSFNLALGPLNFCQVVFPSVGLALGVSTLYWVVCSHLASVRQWGSSR